MRVVLGQKYKETVHGRVGVATSRTEYVAGCARVLLEYLNSDGEVKDICIDETLLVGVELPPKSKLPGGPGEIPPSLGPVPR